MVRHTRKRGGWWWSKKTISTDKLSTEDLLDNLYGPVKPPIETTRKKCTWYQKLRGCKEDKIEDSIGYVKKEKPCDWYNNLVGRCPKKTSHVDDVGLHIGGSQRIRRSRRKRRR